MTNIPKRFQNSIDEGTPQLKKDYYRSIDNYAQVYQENRLYFFEEYTNHGIDHILEILSLSDELIPNKTYSNFIDPQNCFVLILSTFLHDIGMHHTYESFKDLIEDDKICISELDDKPWSQLWKEFAEKANKYDSKKRETLFGDKDAYVTIPDFKSKDDLNGIHKKLIGEFIRIHHPRMAHEIAINGLSNKENTVIEPVTEERNLADLIGLIARSHGTNIRALFQYIEDKYTPAGSLNPLSVHIWYLMGVLRIADYLQIDKNRVRSVPFKISGFTSPISNVEHLKHLAVESVFFSSLDTETLIINANPRDNIVFVELSELLDSIQKELDLTWAILGEKYGNRNRSNKPELTLRRIVSNIQDPKYIRNVIDFIPERIIFNASSDLPYLLVVPLYGEDVSYGVRELIQNSIDACYMRKRLEPDPHYEPKIDCKINYYDGQEDKFVLEIVDNGIGMNADIVKNYFLKAGSTNRRSKEWESFILNGDRTSSIMKSGRFGVGLLSAFLIGDVIYVETRRIGETLGLKFEASLTSENIKVSKHDIDFIGTKIIIPIRTEVLSQFEEKSPNNLIEWDKWYTQSEPSIKYLSVLGKGENLGYKEHYPGINQLVPNSIEFKIKGYNKIRLLFNSNIPVILEEYNKYNLTCNGLIIPKAPPFKNQSIRKPHVQVFDFDGNLPINLGRNTLDTKFLPFEEYIVNLVFLDFLENFISKDAPVFIDNNKIEIKRIQAVNKRYLTKEFTHSLDFLYSQQGIYIKSKKLIDTLQNRNLVVIGCKELSGKEVLSLDFKVKSDDLVLLETTSSNFRGRLIMPLQRSKHLEVALYRKDDEIRSGLKVKNVNNLTEYSKHFIVGSNNFKTSYYFGNINEQELPKTKESKISKLDYIEIFNDSLLLKPQIASVTSFEEFLFDFFEDHDFLLPYDANYRMKLFNEQKSKWLRKNGITNYLSS